MSNVDEWVLKQAELKLGAQHASHGVIQSFRIYAPVQEGRHEEFVMIVIRLKDDIQSAIHCGRGTGRVICRCHVEDIRPAGGTGIGDHKTGEALFALQPVEQPAGMSRGRCTIQTVIRSHDTSGSRQLEGRAKRCEMRLTQVPFAFMDGPAVAPAFSDIRQEMLGRGHDPHAFERPHVGNTHHGR